MQKVGFNLRWNLFLKSHCTTWQLFNTFSYAGSYCRRNYDPEREESREVYLCLIKMYLSPPNLADYGIRLPDGSQPDANVEDALKVLASHHGLIDTAKVF